MLRRLGALSLLLLVPVACRDGEESGDAPPPNVVLLVMDTTRADRCAFAGYARPTTPRLDEFAKSAMNYRNCWSSSSWTAPAHASLFSGLRPETHGLLDGRRPYLDKRFETLAESFAAAGYRTACFSANPNVSPLRGLTQGFETFEATFRLDGRGGAAQGGMPAVVSSAAETHAKALAWIDFGGDDGVAPDRPFFLFVNDMEPHLTYDPPVDAARRFVTPGTADDEIAWARGFQSPADFAVNLGVDSLSAGRRRLLGELYDAEIETLDRQVGRLADALAERGLLDDTIFVVTSDHGENLGDHGLVNHMFSMHASLLRVPLLIRYPPRLARTGVVDDPVRLEDVAPTLLEGCGLALPDGLDGASLLGDTSGRHAFGVLGPPRERLGFLQEMFPDADKDPLHRTLYSVYDGRFHLIREARGSEEFYDVAADPLEETDLAPAGGDDLTRMRKLLESVYPPR